MIEKDFAERLKKAKSQADIEQLQKERLQMRAGRAGGQDRVASAPHGEGRRREEGPGRPQLQEARHSGRPDARALAPATVPTDRMSSRMSLADELYEAQRSRLLALLQKLSYEQREVTLASGAKSNFYIDCKQTVLTAEGHFLVGSLFGRILATRAPDVEAIGGVSVGADPLASAVSTLSFVAGRPLPAFYVRKEAKGHGTGAWIEGTKSLRSGMPVAILEDVVTTGGSALKAIARVREHGLKVGIILGIVDREEGGREVLEKEAPLVTLFRRSDFL